MIVLRCSRKKQAVTPSQVTDLLFLPLELRSKREVRLPANEPSLTLTLWVHIQPFLYYRVGRDLKSILVPRFSKQKVHDELTGRCLAFFSGEWLARNQGVWFPCRVGIGDGIRHKLKRPDDVRLSRGIRSIDSALLQFTPC